MLLLLRDFLLFLPCLVRFLYMLCALGEKNVFIECSLLGVLWPCHAAVWAESSTHSLGPSTKKRPGGHMSSDGTTALARSLQYYYRIPVCEYRPLCGALTLSRLHNGHW